MRARALQFKRGVVMFGRALNDEERRTGTDRRSGNDRRQPRSTFRERIGKAQEQRSGDERRSGTDRRMPPS
jgi:hypothetical protein